MRTRPGSSKIKGGAIAIDPKAGVSLVVPSLEQVGSLRQSTDAEAGKFLLDGLLEQGPTGQAGRPRHCGGRAIPGRWARRRLRWTMSMRGTLSLLLSLPLWLWGSQAFPATASKAAHTSLSATQIVEKYVAARGGLQAWRNVQTLRVTGRIEAGTADSAARSAGLRVPAWARRSSNRA